MESNCAQLLDSLNVFVMVLSHDGAVQDVNPAAVSIIGFSKEELLGKDWSTILYPSDRRNQSFSSDTYKNIGQQYFHCRHKNGDQIPMAFSFSEIMLSGETHILAIAQEFGWMLEREKKLKAQALVDPLTQIDNRMGLSEYVRGCYQTRIPFALLYLDLDKFKSINDSLGHTVGDSILLECVQRIKRQLRRGDEIARVGGDEFVVVCPYVDEVKNARKVANAIRNAILPAFDIGGEAHFIDISIGIVLTDHQAGIDQGTLISLADQAMYKAKNSHTHIELATIKTKMQNVASAVYREKTVN